MVIDDLMGIEKRCHPDWFRESADTIKPAIQHQNKMHSKVLKCIRDMQCGLRGLLPSVSVSIKDENGNSYP